MRLYEFHKIKESIKAYHGSSNGHAAFSATHTGINSHTFGEYHSIRHGIFVATNPHFSAMYGDVQEYNLNISNTLDLDNETNPIFYFMESLDPFGPEREIWIDTRTIFHGNRPVWHLFDDELGERFVKHLITQGYDSAMFTETTTDDDDEEITTQTIVVFDPNDVVRNGTNR